MSTELVTLKNVGKLYIGDDKDSGKFTVKVDTNQDVELSLKKATALLTDFPDQWNIVTASTDQIANLKAILEDGLSRKRASSPRGPGMTGPRTILKTVPAPSIVEMFLSIVNSNKHKVEHIKANAIELISKIVACNFVSVDLYRKDLTLLEGEIGSDIKNNIRYILVDADDKVISLTRKEPESIKVDDEKKEVKIEEKKEPVVLPIKRSRDIDVEDIDKLGAELGQTVTDAEGDDDEDENHPPQGSTPKKRKKIHSDDDDDDDDEGEEDKDDDDGEDENPAPRKARKMRG